MASKTTTTTTSEAALVYGSRVSSVTTATVTGSNRVHNLTGLDLAMKLHYIKVVYFFPKEAVADSSIYDFKKPMFEWLVHFFPTCGRIRVSGNDQTGRPYIKLNDGGVRIVEAHCRVGLEEWLGKPEWCGLSDELLVYQHAIGPDLLFTPLVFIQFTWFKCGGVSVGLSWAHILGDPFLVTSFMNLLGQFMRPNPPSKPLAPPEMELNKPVNPVCLPVQELSIPSSIKRVNPVGSLWVAPSTSVKMISHTLLFSPTDLDRLRSSIKKDSKILFRAFDLISAAIWKSVSNIRGESLVTICRFRKIGRGNQIMRNDGEIYSMEARSTTTFEELAAALAEKAVNESDTIAEAVDREIGVSDFVVYGARLTFVDLEEADLYGFEMKEKRPTFVSFTIGGVGENGAVLVMPTPEDCDSRVVTVILPEKEIEGVKKELKQTWYIGN